MGSSLGPRFGSGLGSGSARAQDYFSRALFGLGSVQGPDRGWLKVGARLRTRLGLAWPGSGSVSHSALFGAGLARSLAQLGSVLTSVHYSLLVSKLTVISPDQLDSTFGSAQLGDRFGLVRSSCLAPFCSKLSSSWLKVWLGEARGFVRLNSSMTPARTRLERRYSAKLCSKLRSASRLGDWLGESEHSSANSKALLGTRSSARN